MASCGLVGVKLTVRLAASWVVLAARQQCVECAVAILAEVLAGASGLVRPDHVVDAPTRQDDASGQSNGRGGIVERSGRAVVPVERGAVDRDARTDQRLRQLEWRRPTRIRQRTDCPRRGHRACGTATTPPALNTTARTIPNPIRTRDTLLAFMPPPSMLAYQGDHRFRWPTCQASNSHADSREARYEISGSAGYLVTCSTIGAHRVTHALGKRDVEGGDPWEVSHSSVPTLGLGSVDSDQAVHLLHGHEGAEIGARLGFRPGVEEPSTCRRRCR